MIVSVGFLSELENKAGSIVDKEVRARHAPGRNDSPPIFAHRCPFGPCPARGCFVPADADPD
jgi:hypothetical protein